jgi:cytochrome c-type biogenesis protein
MVPIYLASLAGPKWLDSSAKPIPRRTVFFHALCFVTGFAIVFTALGFLAGLTGKMISPNSPAVRLVTGTVLIFFGTYMLAAARFPQLNIEKRLNHGTMGRSYLQSLITGAVFTVAWTPCISPILGSVLTLAISSATVWQGSGLLLVYSLGLAVPFLLISLGLGTVLPYIQKIQRFTIGFYVLAGVLLVAAGILIVTGKFTI